MTEIHKSITPIVTTVPAFFIPLLYSLLVFLFHHNYPLASLEVLVVISILLLIAIISSYLNHKLPCQLKSIINTFFFTLVWSILTGASVLVSIFIFFANLILFTFLDKKALIVSTTMFGTMFFIFLLQQLNKHPSTVDNTLNKELPPVVHIVLDEAISPLYFPSSKKSKDTQQFFTKNGFHLHTKAYSRFSLTHFSLASLYNFISEPSKVSNFISFYMNFPNHWNSRIYIKHNNYFDSMKKKGYQLILIQSKYLDVEPDSSMIKINYTPRSINAYASPSLSLSYKLKVILNGISQQSKLTDRLLYYIKDLYVDIEVAPYSNLSTFNDFKIQAGKLKRGELLYAHLVLPHYPYFYDEQCNIKIRPRNKAFSYNKYKNIEGLRNTPQSRLQRYEAYTKQYQCVLIQLEELFLIMKKNKIFDESYVLIHGDHGSRISLHTPRQSIKKLITKQDLIDNYSTLFAFKQPSSKGKVLNESITLDKLFASYLRSIGIIKPAVMDKKIYLFKTIYELGDEIDMPEDS